MDKHSLSKVKQVTAQFIKNYGCHALIRIYMCLCFVNILHSLGSQVMNLITVFVSETPELQSKDTGASPISLVESRGRVPITGVCEL